MGVQTYTFEVPQAVSGTQFTPSAKSNHLYSSGAFPPVAVAVQVIVDPEVAGGVVSAAIVTDVTVGTSIAKLTARAASGASIPSPALPFPIESPVARFPIESPVARLTMPFHAGLSAAADSSIRGDDGKY